MHRSFLALFVLLHACGQWAEVVAHSPVLGAITEDTIGIKDFPDAPAAEAAHAVSMGSYVCVAELVAKSAGWWNVSAEIRDVLWLAAHVSLIMGITDG